jgi:hypothetical protein
MSSSREAPTYNSSLRPTAPRHASKHSVDTNASGLAESTISFSQFPPPPLEIPTTPLRNGFSTPSPVSSRFSPTVHPLRPRRGPTKMSQADEASSARSFTSAAGSNISQQTQVPSNVTRGMSPHDWHDGSSSIDMDPTESRLLPTSLITSLLEENRNLRRAVRGSYTSDAFSGISEMTYPPPPPEHHAARRPFVNPHRGQGARNAPPSAFNPLANVVHRTSTDSATLQGQPGVIQSRSNAGGQGPVVVGVATATLRSVAGSSRPPSSQTVPMSIDEKTGPLYGFTGHDMDDDSILRYKAMGEYPRPAPPPPEAIPRPRLRQHPQPSAQARQSTHSVAPSFVSRISLPASVRKMLRLRKKPLPPVPRIPDIPIAMERATQRAEEAAPLPDLAHRAHALHSLLEKGYHPHHSVGTYHEVPNFPVTPMDPASPYQDSPMEGTSAYQTIRPLYYRDFHQDSDNTKPGSLVFSNQGTTSKSSPCSPLSRRTKWAIGAFIVAAFVGIIAGAATVAVRKKPAPTCASGLAGLTCSLSTYSLVISFAATDPFYLQRFDLRLYLGVAVQSSRTEPPRPDPISQRSFRKQLLQQRRLQQPLVYARQSIG